jgi:hypothetical protein
MDSFSKEMSQYSVNKSQYAVEHEGLVRDAWDEVNLCSCCNFGNIIDYRDVHNMDNAQLGINSLQPNKLLVIASTKIIGSRDLHVPVSMPAVWRIFLV